jgi:hypothetical protein
VPPDNKNSGQAIAALIAEKGNPVADVTYLGGIAADPISVPGSSPAIPYKYDIDSAAGAPPAGSGVPVWTSLPQPYSSVTAGLPAYSSLPFRRTALLIAAMAETPSVAIGGAGCRCRSDLGLLQLGLIGLGLRL